MKNYYEILGLEPGATGDQIKKQYKLMLRAWKAGNFSGVEDSLMAEEKTRLINEAYDTLSDPIRREAYDQTYKTFIGSSEAISEPSSQDVLADSVAPEQEVQSNGKSRQPMFIFSILGTILLALIAFIIVRQLNGSTPPAASEQPPAATIAIASPTVDASMLQTLQAAEPTAAATPTMMPTVAFTASDPATCKPAPIVPVVSAESEALYPSVSDADWTLGPKTASVVVYEYSDFQCPYCAKAAPSLEALNKAYPNDVLIVFRYFPLSSIHPNARLAAQAAESAGIQGKFWQMHDLLFAKQVEWSGLSTDDFKAWLKDAAKSINLNSNQFMTDLDSAAVVQKIAKAESDAVASQLNSTPTFLFNKIRYGGRTDLESLSSIVDYFLLPKKSYTACPAMTIDPEKTYTVTIKTEKGSVVLELYPKQAPWAVNSFVFLARNNWFDGSAFFRVIPGFVAQAGDPSNSSLGGPGYEFTNEVTPELRFDKPGVLGMASTGNNDNGSQFFITYAPVPDLDGKYTIFGQVIEGMDVLSSLRPRNPAADQILVTPDAILSITVEEK
jgi:cyclophilin family peptidyl-prolyl cis-trans isomerase/protein-disulfide isomerase